ncbi:MAG: phosphoribosyltransferase family protein, partial [archaeon]
EKPSFTGQKHQQCSTRYGLDGLVGIWEYEGIVREALFRIKYWSNFDAIPEFIEKAFWAMRKDMPRFEDFLSFLFSENVYITYVPIFIKKKKRRGFNQSERIAQSLGKISGKETVDFLEKIKDTVSQTNLDREERIENVKNSFRILPNLSFIPKKIVLVDDVWTTGSTMKECAKILKIVGVEKIWGFTPFRTV